MSDLVGHLRRGSVDEVKSVAYNLIKNRRRAGKIGVIKEGVYYVVRPGSTPTTTPVDDYLLASKLSPDAVLSFHTALDVLGFSHSMYNTYYYFTKTYRRPVHFRHGLYRSVSCPPRLARSGKELFGTTKIERLGVKVLTTDKERTLVESLEHPEYCGGFEETFRSLEKMPYVRTESLVSYLDLRGQKNLYARVGVFLEQRRDTLHADESLFRYLEQNKPLQPVYWGPRGRGGILIKRGNVIVPAALHEKRWEEF